MSRIEFKLKSLTGVNPKVTLDGKAIKLKKNSFGNYFANVEADEGAVLKVVCWDTILSPLWLLWEMLFFVISVFGIFDPIRDQIKRAVEFEAVLYPEENTKATVSVLRPDGDGSPAVQLECDFDAEIVKNEYYGFETIKKRRKAAMITKIAVWLVLIATAITVVANTF